MSHNLTGFIEVENKKAFRWVFKDSADARNFNPIYTDKARFEYEKKRGKLDFKGWALSFHETLKQSKDSLIHFTNDKPNGYKKLGTHIACGLIQKKDGIVEEQSDPYGHFNQFEYVGVNLAPQFEMVEEMFSE